MDAFDMAAGRRVKRFREMRGMSQRALAERLHDWGLDQEVEPGMLWSQPVIHKLEHGGRPLRLKEAHAIASILGFDMSALLSDTLDEATATIEAQMDDALVVIAEQQQANAGRLAEMHDHQAAAARLNREIIEAGREIDRQQALVQTYSQRLADLQDQIPDEVDDAEVGYEEVS